jgi:hypothetical protein
MIHGASFWQERNSPTGMPNLGREEAHKDQGHAGGTRKAFDLTNLILNGVNEYRDYTRDAEGERASAAERELAALRKKLHGLYEFLGIQGTSDDGIDEAIRLIRLGVENFGQQKKQVDELLVRLEDVSAHAERLVQEVRLAQEEKEDTLKKLAFTEKKLQEVQQAALSTQEKLDADNKKLQGLENSLREAKEALRSKEMENAVILKKTGDRVAVMQEEIAAIRQQDEGSRRDALGRAEAVRKSELLVAQEAGRVRELESQVQSQRWALDQTRARLTALQRQLDESRKREAEVAQLQRITEARHDEELRAVRRAAERRAAEAAAAPPKQPPPEKQRRRSSRESLEAKAPDRTKMAYVAPTGTQQRTADRTMPRPTQSLSADLEEAQYPEDANDQVSQKPDDQSANESELSDGDEERKHRDDSENGSSGDQGHDDDGNGPAGGDDDDDGNGGGDGGGEVAQDDEPENTVPVFPRGFDTTTHYIDMKTVMEVSMAAYDGAVKHYAHLCTQHARKGTK